MELKTIFGIFSVLGMIFVVGSSTFKMLNFDSDYPDESEASFTANTLIKVLTILGIHILAETYVFKSPIPVPMLVMSGFAFIAAVITILIAYKKEDKKTNNSLDKIVEKISNVTLDELRDKFKKIRSVRTKSINAELDKLLEKLSIIDNTDNVTIYKKAQSFANKYLTILYVSVDNYAKLNNHDKKITVTTLSTLKTVNAALDKIISESDELLQEDINSTSDAITALLEPVVRENPFEKA